MIVLVRDRTEVNPNILWKGEVEMEISQNNILVDGQFGKYFLSFLSNAYSMNIMGNSTEIYINKI